MQNFGGMGLGIPTGIPADLQGTILQQILEEFRRQFGNAELIDRNGRKLIVVKLDKDTLKRYVFSKLDPTIASATDLDIKEGAVELIIRVF